MKLMKRLSLFLGMLLLICLSPQSTEASSRIQAEKMRINVIVRGMLIEQQGDGDAFAVGFIKDNRSYIPLRQVSEAMGYQVHYSGKDKKIEISDGSHQIEMHIGSPRLLANKVTRTMDVSPILLDSKTYIPARYLMEAMGESVVWDAKNRIVLLSTYPRDASIEGELKVFTVKGHRFTLRLPKDFNDRMIVKEGENLEFYDRFNQQHSKDGTKGHLCTLRVSEGRPTVIDVPGLVLSYRQGIYVDVAMESGVDYSLEDKVYEKHYNESLELLREVFKTYQMSK